MKFYKDLEQKLTDILPLGEMGIEGLGHISTDDLQKICKWAEGYQPQYKF